MADRPARPGDALGNLPTVTFHFSPLGNEPSPIVPTVDRLSKELTRRVSFASFFMYEMENFICLRRGAYGLCDA
jgi:hypothetical protein